MKKMRMETSDLVLKNIEKIEKIFEGRTNVFLSLTYREESVIISFSFPFLKKGQEKWFTRRMKDVFIRRNRAGR